MRFFVYVVLLAVIAVGNAVPSRWPTPLVDAIVRIETAPLLMTTIYGAQGVAFSFTSSLVAAATAPAPSTPVPTPTPSLGVARTARRRNAASLGHAPPRDLAALPRLQLQLPGPGSALAVLVRARPALPLLSGCVAVAAAATLVAVAAYLLTGTVTADAALDGVGVAASSFGSPFEAAWPTLPGVLPATPAALPAPAVAIAGLPAVAAMAPPAAPVVAAVPAAPRVPVAPAAVRGERSGPKPPAPVAVAKAAPAAPGAFGTTDAWRRILRTSTDESWLYTDEQLDAVIRRIVAQADPARAERIHLVGPGTAKVVAAGTATRECLDDAFIATSGADKVLVVTHHLEHWFLIVYDTAAHAVTVVDSLARPHLRPPTAVWARYFGQWHTDNRAPTVRHPKPRTPQTNVECGLRTLMAIADQYGVTGFPTTRRGLYEWRP